MTVSLPRFFHQCEVPATSGLISPGLVHDRIGAVAGIFDDLALLDEDQRGTIVMAVPGHDATRLDRQLSEAQLSIPDVGRLLLEIDRAKRDVGDADRLGVDHRTDVGLHLAGRAFRPPWRLRWRQ